MGYKNRFVYKYGFFIFLVLIFSFRMSFMNSTNTYNPTLSMSLTEFGYEEEAAARSRFSYEFNYDKLSHSLTGKDGMELRIEARSYSSNKGALYTYEETWKDLKAYEQQLHSDVRCTECKIMRSAKENVFEYIIELNKEQWASDAAYTLYDYHENLPENGYYQHCVMILRGKYMYVITFSESFDLTDENIAVIVSWYDEFESKLEQSPQ